jgi:HEAT repeat protein
MQHLGIAYDDKPEFRKSLKETYYTGLKDKSTDVAGTSLMILTNLSKRFNEFDKDLIKTAAIELAADEDTQHASRISVISKLGELQAKESLPSIRKQIKEGKGIVIKLAAIHSLGMLGEEKDIEVLEGFLADSSEVIYNKAASKALAILKNRI